MGIRKLKASMAMHLRCSLKGHILNPVWHKREERKKKRTSVIVEEKLRYLNLYKEEVRNLSPDACDGGADAEKEHVFTMWLQGEEQAPPLVKACIRSMHRYIGMPVVVLNDKNISDWISLPDYIIQKYEKGIITRAHFSDICRVELLYRHGGIWADSTCLFTSPVPESVMNQDFFIFMTDPESLIGGSHVFIQSCFIRAKKGNPLIALWRKLIHLYWRNENKLIDYFALHLLFKYLVRVNDKASGYFSKMPKVDQAPTHALFWTYKDKLYDREVFINVTKGSFFQKTTYKDPSAANPKPGSFADAIINGDV